MAHHNDYLITRFDILKCTLNKIVVQMCNIPLFHIFGVSHSLMNHLILHFCNHCFLLGLLSQEPWQSFHPLLVYNQTLHR